MQNDIAVLDEIAEKFDGEGFHQTKHWLFDNVGYSTTLEADDGEKLPIYIEIEVTEEDIKEIEEEIVDNIDIDEIEEKIQKKITKLFKKDGYKQNNYWEWDNEGQIYWSSYINYELDGCVVTMFPLTKDDLKK